MLAVGLAMDAFAVSLGIGTTGRACTPRARFRLAFHFGLFQFLMPVLGWLGGTAVARWIGAFDHWVAFALLAFVGVRMIRSALAPDQECKPDDPSRGRTLVMLAVATSIDALAVGLSLAMLRVTVFQPAVVIGLVTGCLTLAALFLGEKLGLALGRWAEALGGLVLIGIGLRVLATHLL
ncbi:MAG: manganese efflux pump MntP [Thiobacillaceae bacterium]